MTGKGLLERRVSVGKKNGPCIKGERIFFDRCFEPDQADWGSKR